jgi:hypothetical protein
MSADATTAPQGLPPFYRRRRFLRAGLPVISMGVALLVGLGIYDVVYGSSGLHGPSIPLTPDPPTPKTVKLQPQTASDLHGLIRQFVHTAVARKNLAVSYRLIGPALRENIPLKQWVRGQVTVQPYPVDSKTKVVFEKPDWTYANDVEYQVHIVTPDRPKEMRLMGTDTFFVDAIRRDGHWLVNNWVPRWTPPIPNGN